MSAVSTRRRLAPEQRRELILESALRVFSERGYHAASIDEIARGAGTTKPVIYDHFATKRELYDAMVAAEIQEMLIRTAAITREGTPRERLTEFAEVFFGYFEDRPHARRVMFETVDAEPEVGRHQRNNQLMTTRAIAARLGEDPLLLAGAPDRELALEMVAQMFKSTINGLGDWWHDRPDVPRRVVVERAVDFLLGGLGAMYGSQTPGGR